MMRSNDNEPEIVVEYRDPREGFKGWLVIDRTVHRICAGGMRIQPGLSREHLCEMARNMTLKMRIADLRVDGAKSGIDYDPNSPGKTAAVARFLKAIAPYIRQVYSMGPDLNIDMNELQAVAARQSIPSVKMAIARAQGWEMAYFLKRSAILSETIDGFSLARLRAGYGVAAAVLAMLKFLGIKPAKASIAIQGFGNLAKAALFGLDRAGCRIVAVADVEKCVINQQGIDLKELLGSNSPVTNHGISHSGLTNLPSGKRLQTAESQAILACECDILVPAALENTVTPEIAEKLQVKGVVPGANLAVPIESDAILYRRGIPVLPDFLAGCGGSLSMEGLYGPNFHPTAREVLDHVESRMGELVRQAIDVGKAGKCSLREAALRICAERKDHPDSRPYGRPE
ncbi:MAG: Glu/Leu/Phe/Val dehydrogenase dimerization domain-containing protein [Desulfobulbales bacterium]|nr:Glu/Leu/Phe/Val dehydrogenase dimerization domain-containing protein [Desulfobulbales bacterium]